tara:strand:- start:359 stop:529 length:171 start_codon:yes stop_codon:yes gene_type:complete
MDFNLNYIIKKLHTIVKKADEHHIDSDSIVDGYDYLLGDVEELIRHLEFNKEMNNL